MNSQTLSPKTDLNQHVQDLRNSARNVAQDVKTEATTRFNEVRDQANSKIQDAREQAGQHLAKVRSSANDLYASSRDFVKEHPLAAIGAGVLIGAALVWSARRK